MQNTRRTFLQFAAALTSLTVLGLVTARPVFAQELKYQLFGVTFNDGAVAFGYFDYNLAANQVDAYDIKTTDGVTDDLTGSNYSSEMFPPHARAHAISSDSIQFVSNAGDGHALSFDSPFLIMGPGLYALSPGSYLTPTSYKGSGESATTTRLIETGSLYVTEFNPVPEASTTVSFGLLLALGMGGMVIAARMKKEYRDKEY